MIVWIGRHSNNSADNAAIAFDVMKAGSRGFTGGGTNFHPDLYKWLLTEADRQPELADELSVYLAIAAIAACPARTCIPGNN
ncbi:hypothetical protein [Rhizobium sp. AN95]|uniref:hypothetical protein n=1 Tax=Rhizobium sp. AN95 TaxID=3035216 RepID=UPI002B258DBD|nr:hypothetical protein [Rhizobium sp. AN95]